MLSGITVFCFAASYFVAFVLEVSRLVFRSAFRQIILVAFAAAGLLAHTLYLAHRAAHTDSVPLSSAFDWYLVAAWILAAAYLYMAIYHARTSMGLFVLPLVLALIGVAEFAASQTPFARERASQVWGTIHGVLVLLGTVAVLVGFVAGVTYLLQAYLLKHKQMASQRFRLPTLEWLQQVNSRALIVSAVMLTAGFLSGVVLNLVNHRREVDELPWTDPIVWTSLLLLCWLLAVWVFGVVYKPAFQGRKVAYLTVASFLFLVLSVGMRLLLVSEHSATGKAAVVEEPMSIRQAAAPGGAT